MNSSASADVAALEAVIEVGGDIAMFGSSVPELSASWETLYASRLAQMIPEAEADPTARGEVPQVFRAANAG